MFMKEISFKKWLVLVFTLAFLIQTSPWNSADTGGTITTVGTDTIHTFTTNGTYSVDNTDKTITILLVAGGGGGSGNSNTWCGGGGGGAGGVIYNTSVNVNANTNYTVVIGSGGAGGLDSNDAGGSNGSATLFGTILRATEGGGGGGLDADGKPGKNGGSGGGGGGRSTQGIGGTGITGQGYAGGNAATSSGNSGGGGGGAGAAGQTAPGANTGGAGGVGLNFSINGTNTYYGGGGGGGTNEAANSAGGAGGGGAGKGTASGGIDGDPGTDGLGGGGGAGGCVNTAGGKGGNGILIIRYATPAGAPSLTFISPTPSNLTKKFNETNKNITASISLSEYSSNNITVFLYTASGLYSQYSNTSGLNYSYTFSNLPVGTYYLNATAKNATGEIRADTRTITVYSLSLIHAAPTAGQAITRDVNFSWTETINPAATVTITNRRLELRNAAGALISLLSSNTTSPFALDTLTYTNLTLGNYQANITVTDSQGNNKSDLGNLFNLTRNAQLNITSYYPFGDLNLSNFTINIINTNTSTSENFTTTTGTVTAPIIRNNTYNLTLYAAGYAITTESFTANDSTFQKYAFTAYTSNSVYINIYDESTLTLINSSQVTITFNNNITVTTYYTSNGTFYKDGLLSGLWEIRFYNSNYSYRTYTITVNNNSYQVLNAYLIPGTYTTIFNIKDSLTLATLEGVTFTMERLSNSSWIITESKLSDVTGSVQIAYLPGVEYRFSLSKTGYTSKVFTLDPVIYASYNLYLDKINVLVPSYDYGLVTIIYYPKSFANNQANNFIFQITSPTGVLTDYAISISGPGGSDRDSGVLATGETFNLTFNIINATLFDRVNLTFNYTSTVAGFKSFQYAYGITGAGLGGNYTIAGIKNRDYGLGLFERVLIVTVAVVIIAGFAYGLVGLAGGMMAGILVYGVASWLGFIPLWSMILTVVAGIIIIVASSLGGQK